MIAALARFIDALRAEDHPVSPAELLDASKAVDLVGLERRDDVRNALRTTLAKDRRAAAVFDRLFDRFFAPPRRAAGGEGVGRPGSIGERPKDAPDGRGPKPRRTPKDETEPPRRSNRPSTDSSEPALQRTKRSGERRQGRLRRVKLERAAASADDPARRDLARRMTTDEERAIAREIPRIVSALRLSAGRRGTASRSGRPWLRRVLRENLAHGGVPFVIPFRARKRRSTRVVLLVDVSYSVARSAGLFLLMAAEFLELGRRARVLAFVDRPVDATGAIVRWARGAPGRRLPSAGSRRARRPAPPGEGIVSRGVSFAEVVDGLRDLNLEAPSDYGTAFHALATSRLRPRGRDTVLVVLGDGRSNRFDPLPWALGEVARGCRAVLWLVSEPRSRWGTADSALPAYLGSIDLLVEAADLHGLAAGLGEIVRRA